MLPAFQLILCILAALLLLGFLLGIRLIPNKRIGIVEKRFGGGSVHSGLIALHGEAGYQPDVLRGGIHWRMPFQYIVHIAPLVTIRQGQIGYVFARDGRPLEATQVLASNVEAGNFEDVRDFLSKGGQRGPQRRILREGTYALNLAQFVVITADHTYFLPLQREEQKTFLQMTEVLNMREGFTPVVIAGADDQIGVVTVHDGPALPSGEIIAPVVGNNPEDPIAYHNNFQSPEAFLHGGGRRGRQLQVLVEGTYYINRLFASVEMMPKTIVDVGWVGVVVSYTGDQGADLSGTEYKHGELVRTGHRGVWQDPILPGKYAFNMFAGKVILVPTTNFILKWIESETGVHKYDENLSEVGLITRDAFEPWLPLSVVVHIDYRKAPLVIQRFGDIRRLVEQTLDPMVSAYFKNIAQTRTLIELIHDRAAIQAQALKEMSNKFDQYNLELQEVLIGTPEADKGDERFETILTQLRQRQIALEQIETYGRQEQAAAKERELREAEARARQQQTLTESDISIAIQTNQGKAEYQRSLQQAAQIQALAAADAGKIRVLAEAEAERAARVGIAQAMAIDEQVRAYGGPQFQLTQQVMNRFAEAIQESRVDVVPKIMIAGSSTGTNNQPGTAMSGGIMEALLTMLLSDKLSQTQSAANLTTPRSPEAENIRNQITKQMASPKKPN